MPCAACHAERGKRSQLLFNEYHVQIQQREHVGRTDFCCQSSLRQCTEICLLLCVECSVLRYLCLDTFPPSWRLCSQPRAPFVLRPGLTALTLHLAGNGLGDAGVDALSAERGPESPASAAVGR